MSGISEQFALGVVNFAIGFGAGWFCRRPNRSDEQSPEQEGSPAVSADVASMLQVVDEIDGATSDQEKSNQSLRTLIGGHRVDAGQQLGGHAQSNRHFRRLLRTYQRSLQQHDPQRLYVPEPFTAGIEHCLQAVCLLTDELDHIEEHPDDQITELIQRLERLEQSNTVLRSEIDSARRTINEQATRLSTVEFAAFEDFLTKLPNRRSFDQRFSQLKDELNAGGSPFCMLLIDLDHFKDVNDTYGHECGDAVLAIVAHVIQDVCRGQDHVARYGGEEFAVLATETDLQGARILAERIRSRVESTATRHGDTKIRMTCSIGIARAGQNCTADQLFEFADQALYVAKEAGRNQIHVHDSQRELSPV